MLPHRAWSWPWRRTSAPLTASDLDVWPRRSRRRLPSTPDQVARARRLVRRQIDDGHPLSERLPDLLLAVTEAVTNALCHTRSGAVDGEVVLDLLVTRDGLRVCVRDAGGAGFPCIVNAGTEAVGGRGMALVDRLSDRWGFACNDKGSLVWMDFGDCHTLHGEGVTA